jgi:hypothetical protein
MNDCFVPEALEPTVYAGASGASQCLSLWQPQIIKSFGLTDMQTGILNALPFGIASVRLMVLWGQSSDRTGERVWHTVPMAAAQRIRAGPANVRRVGWLRVDRHVTEAGLLRVQAGPSGPAEHGRAIPLPEVNPSLLGHLIDPRAHRRWHAKAERLCGSTGNESTVLRINFDIPRSLCCGAK